MKKICEIFKGPPTGEPDTGNWEEMIIGIVSDWTSIGVVNMDQKRIGVFFGSETGTAEDVAYMIFNAINACTEHQATIYSMDSFCIEQLPSLNIAIFVVSTTGDGDVPSNMKKFWNFLLRKSLGSSSLSNLVTATFGLGDSNYEKYNAAARMLNRRLLQLGAQPLINLGLGDDQAKYGYVQELDKWLSALYKALHSKGVINTDSPKQILVPTVIPYVVDTSNTSAIETFPRQQIVYYNSYAKAHGGENAECFVASVSNNIRLTSADWGQDVRLVDLTVPVDLDRGSLYVPGDIATVFPQNDPVIASRALRLIRVSSDDVTSSSDMSEIPLLDTTILHIRHHDMMRHHRESFIGEITCTAGELVSKYLDIQGIPRRSFFSSLASFATSDEIRDKLLELASAEGTELYFEYVVRAKRNYVEIMEDFRSCRPPLQWLLEMIPLLAPRKYSIASSSKFCPNQLQLCVALSSTRMTHGRTRVGVCSGYLSRLQPADDVVFYFEKGAISHMPKSFNVPMILIGPGTGIAPLRAVVHDRIISYLYRTFGAGLINSSTAIATCESGYLTDVGQGVSLASQFLAVSQLQVVSEWLQPTLIYFGCRRSQSDFLFGGHWLEIATQLDRFASLFSSACQSGLHERHLGDNLTASSSSSSGERVEINSVEAGTWPTNPFVKLSVAFSQDQQEKIYVTDKLLADKNIIWSSIKAGAFIIVAGTAKSMPRDVRNALKKIIENGLLRDNIQKQRIDNPIAAIESISTVVTPEISNEAERYLMQMQKEKRYIVEAW